jgi:hypothetical protein
MCNVWQNIKSVEFKWDRYFVNEVETQLREKPLRGTQTQEIYYSEDKAYKDSNPTWTPPNQVTNLKGSSLK